MKAMWKVVALAIMMTGISSASTRSEAETVIRKSLSYFSISGKTPEDLDRELSSRGPLAKSTGSRHPGATKVKFGGTVTYYEGGGRCAVREAKVTLSIKIILPRWTNRRCASAEMGFVWDTLAADIKRHEERHAEIARTHAKLLEKALLSLGTAKSCAQMKDRVAIASAKAIEAHGADQRRFDRIESANFENRIMRLMRHRMGKLD